MSKPILRVELKIERNVGETRHFQRAMTIVAQAWVGHLSVAVDQMKMICGGS
jgi:hypothetical protein